MMRLKKRIGVFFAAVSIYTRLPLWRLMTLEEDHYQNAISALPLVGFLTGGLMAFVYSCSYHLLSLPDLTCILLAISSRLFFTSAFHEDGLGDFFDGFGGGRDRASILNIMKDTRVGSYAVIAFVIYYALFVSLITATSSRGVSLMFIIADVFGKQSVLFLVQSLPYAREKETSKLGLVYQKPMKLYSIVSCLLLLPLIISLNEMSFYFLLIPFFFAYFFYRYIGYKLSGYTGDTCGAMMLLVELMVWLSYIIFHS